VDYKFTAEPHSGYMHTRAEGRRTPENLGRFLQDTYLACVKAGKSSVLLEVRLVGESLPLNSIFEVISRRSADGGKLRKIAYVEQGSAILERSMFAETVAKNRGVNVRLFSDLEGARLWLDDPEA